MRSNRLLTGNKCRSDSFFVCVGGAEQKEGWNGGKEKTKTEKEIQINVSERKNRTDELNYCMWRLRSRRVI